MNSGFVLAVVLCSMSISVFASRVRSIESDEADRVIALSQFAVFVLVLVVWYRLWRWSHYPHVSARNLAAPPRFPVSFVAMAMAVAAAANLSVDVAKIEALDDGARITMWVATVGTALWFRHQLNERHRAMIKACRLSSR